MSQSDPLQVKIKLQQSVQSGKPIYANVATVQNNQGMSIVDFGFYDPSASQSAVKESESQIGNKSSVVIDAYLSRRIILSQEAAIQLAQQLNRLFTKSWDIKKPQSDSVMADMLPNEIKDGSPDQGKDILVNSNSGFRFPWFRKKQ